MPALNDYYLAIREAVHRVDPDHYPGDPVVARLAEMAYEAAAPLPDRDAELRNLLDRRLVGTYGWSRYEMRLDRVRELAWDVMTQTMHGPPPMETTARLAEALLTLIPKKSDG